jgi:ornithine--oxo-acid transaminase
MNIAAEEAAALARFLLIDLRMPTEEIDRFEREAVVGNYRPPEDLVLMTDGSLIYGEDGRCWLDLQGAYSANNAGNCNPRVTGANHLASSLTSVLSRARRNRQLPLAAKELQRALGTDYRLLPMNSGCEAIEGAVLLAKLAYNRLPRLAWKRDALEAAGIPPKVVACRNNFHGRSSWAKAVSTNPAYRDPFEPNTMEDDLRWVDFGDIKSLERAFEEGDVSVFVAEPIQCEGGMNMPPPDYFRQARDLCDRYDILMVLDEVQTGLGRTGRMLAQQHWFDGKAEADFIALAKSLSGGQEVVSAILVKPEYAELVRPSEHGSTFGGSPKACATMRAAVREIEDRDLCRQAELKGEFLLETIKDICNGAQGIIDVRGLGLAIGIEVEGHGADDICARLRDTPFIWRGRELAGAWTNATHGITDETTVVRISPPLNVSLDLLAAAMPAIAKAVGHRNPELFRVSEVGKRRPFVAAAERLHHEAHYLGCRISRFYDDFIGTYIRRP